MGIMGHKRVGSCLSVLVWSDSGEDDWLKVIVVRSNCLLQVAKNIAKHCDLTASNSKMISWDQGRIKKTKEH